MSFMQRSNVVPFQAKTVLEQEDRRQPRGLDILFHAADLAQRENALEVGRSLIDAIYFMLDAQAAQVVGSKELDTIVAHSYSRDDLLSERKDFADRGSIEVCHREYQVVCWAAPSCLDSFES